MQLEHVGLNHLSWERKVLVDGVDRLPELIDEHADELAEEVDLPAELVRLCARSRPTTCSYFYFDRRRCWLEETDTTARAPRR